MSTFEELQQRAAKKGMYLRIAKPEGYAVGLTGSNGWELSTTYVSNLKDAEHFIARRESFLKKDAELQPSKYKSDPAKAEAKRMLAAPKTMALTKVFDGERYTFHQAYENKLQAEKAAQDWKNSSSTRLKFRIRKLDAPHYDAFTRTSFPYGLYFAIA
jgi:hypothetical protein